MFSKIKTLSSFSLSLCHMLQPLEPSWLLSSGYFSASKYLLHIWEPKLDTVFQMWPHKCQVEESNNFSSPAGCTLVNLAWYVVGLHYLKGAVLTLVQLFHWDPHVPFCRAVISLVSPQPIPLHGVFFVLGARLSCQPVLQLVQGLLIQQPCPPAHQPLPRFHIMHVLRVRSNSSRSLSMLNSISLNIAPWGTPPITSWQ